MYSIDGAFCTIKSIATLLLLRDQHAATHDLCTSSRRARHGNEIARRDRLDLYLLERMALRHVGTGTRPTAFELPSVVRGVYDSRLRSVGSYLRPAIEIVSASESSYGGRHYVRLGQDNRATGNPCSGVSGLPGSFVSTTTEIIRLFVELEMRERVKTRQSVGHSITYD